MTNTTRRLVRKPGRPIIAVTLGDAAGVGPELCLHLLALKEFPGDPIPLIIGSGEVLARVAHALKIPFTAKVLDQPPEGLEGPAVFDPPGVLAGGEVLPGKLQAGCGRAAARYVEEAARGCLERRYAAMVTAPLNKKALDLAGLNYPGHTEMLAALTQTASYAMLFFGPQIACAFVTCHQSLRSVPDALSSERIVEVAQLAWKAVAALRGKPPRLALLGLNPHAGEDGLFGDEERRVLIPARELLLKRGLDVEGPLPPDTAFLPAARKRYGCYLAMYHDQGAIPFKMLAFDSGVNVTLGLPIIRTSPDHGTAFEIAWRGKVRPDSFLAAYELAVRLSSQTAAATRTTTVRSISRKTFQT